MYNDEATSRLAWRLLIASIIIGSLWWFIKYILPVILTGIAIWLLVIHL